MLLQYFPSKQNTNQIIFSDVITKYTRQHVLYVSESTITNIERNGCYFWKINEQAETEKPVKE